jgi:hypothetical protein
MSDTTIINTNNKENQITHKNLLVAINHKYFSSSLTEIVKLIKATSETYIKTEENDVLWSRHVKVQSVCDELEKGFTNKDIIQGKIIKKIYRVLTSNIDKLYSEDGKSDISLFSLKNKDNAVITIIPGLDMGLVVKMLSDEEIDKLWLHMYMLYVSTVNMVSLNNNLKKNGRIWEIIPMLTQKLADAGILKDNKILNPFIGITADTEEYNVEEMFNNIEEFKTPDGITIDNIIKMLGFDKLINMEQLNEQLQNMKQNDIDDTTKVITKMIGADGDNDIGEICGTLMTSIVQEMGSNTDKGIMGIFDTVKSVTNKIGASLDKNKMKKTVDKLSSFMENSDKTLQNMKDDNGNNVGADIMKNLEGPLQMLKSFEKDGGNFDMSKLQNMMKQMGCY